MRARCKSCGKRSKPSFRYCTACLDRLQARLADRFFGRRRQVDLKQFMVSGLPKSFKDENFYRRR